MARQPAALSPQIVRHGPMLRYVTIGKFAAESGYTEDAIRTKIKNGVWLHGSVWIKAPDGRNLIDVQGYERWAEGQMIFDLQRRSGR